ncbi:unnamed protein product [Blepharisma stoltei]|uniref:Uncharacterized protein n=1 Tax=Blepharisma stoltei TaxID=1481888 RepID=A0AAU9IUR8_9CILI|nr:unnamed protein product [Blepharisma stoltei]
MSIEARNFKLPLIGRIKRSSIDESFSSSLTHREKRNSTQSPPKIKLDIKRQTLRKLFLASREAANKSLDCQTTRVGPHAKLEYFDCYLNLPSLCQRHKFEQVEDPPSLAYLEEVDKEKLNPKPFGIVKRKGPESSIDIHNYSMGDNYANAFSEGLGHLKEIDILNVRENRLSEFGSARVISKLSNKRIKRIILAGNIIGTQAVNTLIELLNEKYSQLKHLDLENTKLSEKHIGKICNCVSENKTLSSLSLARNNIGDESAKFIREMIRYNQQLRVLDLHWNNIRGTGGIEIFDGINQNDGLQQLDLSWNALGRNHNIEAASALSHAIQTNTTLLHLDISYNSFTSKECEELTNGLNQNHTLLGLHVYGNSCTINSRGFLTPTSTNNNFENSHHFRRMTHFDAQAHKKEERLNCWICEKWEEVTIRWIPGVSGTLEEPIFLHLECDEYKPEYLLKNSQGIYETTRVIPPGVNSFFFSNLEGPAVSLEFSNETIDIPLQIKIQEKAYKITYINRHDFKGIPCDIKDIFNSKPREEAPSYIPREMETEYERIVWTVPQSLFKNYDFDTENKYMDGFEFDFRHTRIPNFVKKPEDLEAVKEYLKKIYKDLRETYRFLSAGSGSEIFSITSNSLLDFLNQASVFDDHFSISDLGVLWNSVNSQTNKDQIYNSGNGLCRYEFIEIIARIANDKYVKHKIVSNAAEGIEKLTNDHLLPIITLYDTNKWRLEKYVCEDVDLVLKAYKPILDAVYKRYSGKKALPGQKPFMSLEEFRALCNDANLQSSTFAAREVDVCYSQSMMTQIDDLYQKRHLEMSFIEYIEAVSRAAYLANLPKIGDEETVEGEEVPACKRIENAMGYLLRVCPQALKDTFVPPTEETYRKMMYRAKPKS